MTGLLPDLAAWALAIARAAGGGTPVCLVATSRSTPIAMIGEDGWRSGDIERLLDTRPSETSILAWEGGAAAWDDDDIALASANDGRLWARPLLYALSAMGTIGPAFADLPEGWTTLPSPFGLTSAHHRLQWEGLLPDQIAAPNALLDGGARLLRQGQVVALCGATLSSPLSIRRIP